MKSHSTSENRVVGLSNHPVSQFLLLFRRVELGDTEDGFRSIAQWAFPEQIQRMLSHSHWLSPVFPSMHPHFAWYRRDREQHLRQPYTYIVWPVSPLSHQKWDGDRVPHSEPLHHARLGEAAFPSPSSEIDC